MMNDILPRYPLMYSREQVIGIILARFTEAAMTKERLERIEEELAETKKMAAKAIFALADGDDHYVRELLRDIQTGARR